MKKLFLLLIVCCFFGCVENIAKKSVSQPKPSYDSIIKDDKSIVVEILIDSSGSMENDGKWNSAKNVLSKISTLLDDYQNKHNNVYVILYTFWTKTDMFLYEKERFQKEIKNLPFPSGNTPLGDVTNYIYDCMPSKGTKHVFILTDGYENGSIPIKNVLEANKDKASVYFVAFKFDKKKYEVLSKYAKMFQADNADELNNITFEIFQKNILVEKEDDE